MKVVVDGEEKDMWALWYDDDTDEVVFIDQRKLPHRFEIYRAKDYSAVAFAIKDMVVRGAPAIGAAAAFGMAQAMVQGRKFEEVAKIIAATRPTANDLFFAIDFMRQSMAKGKEPTTAADEFVRGIVDRCRRIGENGAPLIEDGMRILTHCNAGALATVDYGTALAPMRVAHKQGKKIFVFVDETRPRLQGAKLTAWELRMEGIDHALIADNAAGHYMRTGEIDLVITGTDRVTASGDFANKIGTYEKAVVARANDIPFYVAAPISTFDFSIKSGSEIPIEERGPEEVLVVEGNSIAPEGTPVRNPAFDVTPGEYVKAFITEDGVFPPDGLKKMEW
jgi:translation initiation factor eIF-2B subunit alpha/methylthioribose-1-phosphate isomerase